MSVHRVMVCKITERLRYSVEPQTVCRVLAIAALLQGWLCAMGFVFLANVLQCAVAHERFCIECPVT